MRHSARVLLALIISLSILGCSGSKDGPKPGPSSTPGVSASPGATSTPGDATNNSNGQSGSTNSGGTDTTADGQNREGERKTAIKTGYDARTTKQTSMNIEEGMKVAYQNSPSSAERERIRKKNKARIAARLAARERQRGSGVDAPVSDMGETITVNVQ